MVAGVGVVDQMVAKSRQLSRCQGELLALVHEVAVAAPQAGFAAVEVAFALTLTRFSAERQVRLAAELCERLPQVLAALSHGDIDLPKAVVFVEVLSALDTELARKIADAVLPKAPEKTTGQLRQMLRRKAIAADPTFTSARRQRSEANRSVQLHSDDEGTASLVAFGLDATRTTAAFQRIGSIARARRMAGCPGKLEQLRADVMLELLEGQHQTAPAGVIHLDVSLETLALASSEPAVLGAYGPVAADIARQFVLAHPGFQWQFAVRDADGSLLQQGLTRARPGGGHPCAGPKPGDVNTSRLDRADPARQQAESSTAAAKQGETSPSRKPRGTNPSGNLRGKAAGPENGLARGRPEGEARPAAQQASDSGPAAQQEGEAGTAVRRGDEAGAVGLREGEVGPLERPPGQDSGDRFANAAMARWIRARERTCRAPGCRMPAVRCQLDHTIRFTDGGPTAHGNLCALCEHHHMAKDEGGWTVIQTRPGHFRWISPMGRVYDVGPEPP